MRMIDKKNTLNELETISRRIRGRIIEISHHSKTLHLGSSLSCVDILVALYWGIMNIDPSNVSNPERNRFILSKGHAATALYAVLELKGLLKDDLLSSYAIDGESLPEHPTLGCAPGVEVVSGSLGHGLSLGLGMALAGKIRDHKYLNFVLMSDGKCNEGSVWEAAMLAPAIGVDNLVAIVDYNKWQATGRSNKITSLAPLDKKWEAFGWSTYEVDGHNTSELLGILQNIPDSSSKPVAIIANTIKGKGVSFMEDDNNWHYRIPTSDEVEEAFKELGLT